MKLKKLTDKQLCKRIETTRWKKLNEKQQKEVIGELTARFRRHKEKRGIGSVPDSILFATLMKKNLMRKKEQVAIKNEVDKRLRAYKNDQIYKVVGTAHIRQLKDEGHIELVEARINELVARFRCQKEKCGIVEVEDIMLYHIVLKIDYMRQNEQHQIKSELTRRLTGSMNEGGAKAISDCVLVARFLAYNKNLPYKAMNELFRRIGTGIENGIRKARPKLAAGKQTRLEREISNDSNVSSGNKLPPVEFDDISDEAWDRAYGKLSDWNATGSLQGWCFTIGYHEAHNIGKKTKNRNECQIEHFGEFTAEAISPEDIYRAEKHIECVNNMLAEAPPKIRQALMEILNQKEKSFEAAARKFKLYGSDLTRWLKGGNKDGNSVRKERIGQILSVDDGIKKALEWLRSQAKDEGKDLFGPFDEDE